MASRIDIYALPTTRKTWKEHLGLQVRDGPIGRFSSDSSSDDYDALVLRDGQRIARHDVPSRIQCVEDIVTLRREEKPDSRFPWDEVIKHRTLTNTDIRALCDVFSDGQETSLRVLSFLAEAAEQNGDTTTALRLATTVLQEAEGNEWLDVYRGVKPRAATLAVRLGGQQARVIACQDLADRAVANSWFPRELTHGLPSIIKALDPDLDAGLLWSAVRVHLEGIAEPLSLPIGDVLTDHGCRWWLPEDTADKRAASDHHTPAAALAELVVGHLSHPAWVIRGELPPSLLKVYKCPLGRLPMHSPVRATWIKRRHSGTRRPLPSSSGTTRQIRHPSSTRDPPKHPLGSSKSNTP